jgi:uncharacterized membrane protein YqjE
MDERNGASAPSVQFLLGGIVSDIRQLLRQEVQLARCELYDEWRKLRVVLCAVAAGGVFLASSVLPLAFAFVYLLHEVAGLPRWGAFGLVGGVLFVLGLTGVGLAAYKAVQIRVIPPQTAETLKENVEWLRKQM